MSNPPGASAKAVSGATPLFAVPFVALDTETTGLDPASARIVEIAAVRVTGGTLDPEPPLVARIDPEIPIPPVSTSIHGITSEMLAGAPVVGRVLPRVQAFIKGRLLIGHAVGFDLAVLASEARRARLDWQKPRSLCVRMLAMIAAPNLANHSLDGVAQWLGIEIVNRHSALGDAEAAAKIFLALIPELEKKGIINLAQAERACRQRSAEREGEDAAGWTAPVGAPAPAIGTLSATDTFAYRHLVEDVMAREPAILAETEPLEQAMKTMVERNISSVLVAADPAPGQPMSAYGILTERDVLRRIAVSGPGVLLQPAGGFASRPLHSIRAKAFVYRAISRLARLGVRHLVVRSENGRLEGVVSARDLLRTQGGAAVALDDAIQVAATPKALAAAWSTLPAVAAALVSESIDARLICRVVSEEIRAMTRQSAILAERAMAEAGQGEPPVPYAVLVLGSGGRGESLLAPDQDNAIVFDAARPDGEPGGGTDKWFEELGMRLSEILDQAGIPLCKGGVMARNAQWRGSFDVWQARIAEWVGKSRPEDLLNVDIFFDMVPVHGDFDLGQRLFAHAYAAGASNPVFAKLLGDGLAATDPFTLLGGLKLVDGRIDLKSHGLFPIVKLARSLSIRHGLALRSTSERLGALAGRTGGKADLEALDRDHAVVLAALLQQQARDIEAGLPPTNRLDPRSIPREQLERLRQALRHIRSVPDLVRDLMFG